MDDRKRGMKGSPTRDAFKRWHKELGDGLWAIDLDFVLISKEPEGIVAVLDYKTPADIIDFAEGVAYNTLVKSGIDVYIISTNPTMPPYSEISVRYYAGGDWRPYPPICKLILVLDRVSVKEYVRWEKELRKTFSRGG